MSRVCCKIIQLWQGRGRFTRLIKYKSLLKLSDGCMKVYSVHCFIYCCRYLKFPTIKWFKKHQPMNQEVMV